MNPFTTLVSLLFCAKLCMNEPMERRLCSDTPYLVATAIRLRAMNPRVASVRAEALRL